MALLPRSLLLPRTGISDSRCSGSSRASSAVAAVAPTTYCAKKSQKALAGSASSRAKKAISAPATPTACHQRTSSSVWRM